MVEVRLRERKKQQTHEAILRAAVELFERNGYDATTIDDIAAQAGVSSRTLLRYFDTKADLVLPAQAGADYDDDEVADLIRQRPASEPPLDAALTVLREMASAIVEDDPLVARQLRIVMGNPSLETLMAAQLRDPDGPVARSLGARIGQPTDALATRVLAGAFAETMWAAIQHWVEEGADPGRLDDSLRTAFDELRRGISPRAL